MQRIAGTILCISSCGAILFSASAAFAEAQASRAADFQNIWSVAGHMEWYNDKSKVVSDMQYAGIKHWRDGIADTSPTSPVNIAYHQLFNAGITLIGLPWYTSGQTVDLTTVMNQLHYWGTQGSLFAIEGWNEPNNFPIQYNGILSSSTDWSPVANFQIDLYTASKADPVLHNIPVLNASLIGAERSNVGMQYLTIPSPAPAGVLFRGGTQYADGTNQHIYTGWNDHAQTIDQTGDHIKETLYGDVSHTWQNGYNGYTAAQADALPKYATEYGYAVSGSERPLDLLTAAKNNVTGFLNAWIDGYILISIYTFYEATQTPGWGIFASPGNPRPTANYLHNLSVPIADTAANARTFTPGSLGYTFSELPSTGASTLLQKSNGTFELVVWNNINNWDWNTNTPITISPTNVTINFTNTASSINVYDITLGSAPIQSLTNANAVTFALRDYPMVVEIGAVATSTPTPPPICTENWSCTAWNACSVTVHCTPKAALSAGSPDRPSLHLREPNSHPLKLR
jgi:hypothetical protein